MAGPDSSQNFMDKVKIIDLTRLCIQITNTVAVFPNIHTSNLKKKSKTKNMVHVTVNRKY